MGSGDEEVPNAVPGGEKAVPSQADEAPENRVQSGEQGQMAEKRSWVGTADIILSLITRVIAIIVAIAVFSGWLADQFAERVNSQIEGQLEDPESELGRLGIAFGDLNTTLTELTERIGSPPPGSSASGTIYAQLAELAELSDEIRERERSAVPRTDRWIAEMMTLRMAVSDFATTNASLQSRVEGMTVTLASMEEILHEHTHPEQ